jgi:hypothetical protein
MTNGVFILTLAALFSIFLGWSFRALPREEWQIIASLPTSRNEHGQWQGTNMTWYGLLTANAYLAAVVLLLVLLGAIRVPLGAALTVAGLLLAVCVPASKTVAFLVEGKRHTFTVGGAVFIGIIAAPWMIVLANQLPWIASGAHVPVIPTLAAMGAAYAVGEGLGRTACISFGCCYGKPLSQSHPLVGRLFSRWGFIFAGETKKIAYAGGLEGERVIPVQALTAVLYIVTGLLSAYLFLENRSTTAFLLAILVTQGWRVYSETLRADYRGEGRISAYQVMGLAAIPYSLSLAAFFPGGGVVTPEALVGLRLLWQPAMVLLLQAFWLLIFLYTGRSAVTGSVLTFHVHRDRI